MKDHPEMYYKLMNLAYQFKINRKLNKFQKEKCFLKKTRQIIYNKGQVEIGFNSIEEKMLTQGIIIYKIKIIIIVKLTKVKRYSK